MFKIIRNMVLRLVYVVIALAAFIFLIVAPSMQHHFFAAIIFTLSMAVGYILEIHRIKHNMAFFTREQVELNPWKISIITAISVLTRSTITALVALFVFASKDTDFIQNRSLLLAVIVLGALLFAYAAEKISNYNMVRVTYFYFPILFGTIFALLAPDVADFGFFDKISLPFGRHDDLNSISDKVRVAALALQNSMEFLLKKIVGDIPALVLSRIFSMNTLFGYVISLYVCLLLGLQKIYR